MIKLHLLMFIIFLTSCYKEREEKLYTISGKLVDSTRNRNYHGFKMSARSIFGSSEKALASSIVDSNGNFKISYYLKGENIGNNLRIAITPSIITEEKFEFLPLGENWHKIFYVGDSAVLNLKISRNINANDTIFIFTQSGDYAFVGPTYNNILGTIRITNRNSNIYYILNKSKLNTIGHRPTGDPIVDTLTLDINP